MTTVVISGCSFSTVSYTHLAMKRYSKEFKEEALKLSDEIGVKKAAQQLGIAYFTLAAVSYTHLPSVKGYNDLDELFADLKR